MKYYSTKGRAKLASFRNAVFKGLPDDNGLYMPETIPMLPSSFYLNLDKLSLAEIGLEVLKPYVGNEIPDSKLFEILSETLNFDIPLAELSENIYILELYHGPTFAFKDIGARFLARCLGYFSEKTEQKITVLVATSGDTGSAVAHGFYDVPNIEVVILYPSGKISQFQEQQMTTLGKNITALEINGTFDDCQALVKKAFMDDELNDKMNLTSANSINIARLLPQSIYYFYGWGQLPSGQRDQLVVSVPSGNYGNLTAGLIAQKMGLPIQHFIASSNINDTVPKYLETSQYISHPSIQTISNAMDVGDPSNFVRMLDIFSNSHKKMRDTITGFSFSDEETREAIREVYEQTGYVMDPHGAVGYLGLKSYLKTHDMNGIFLETAHPAKFKETVEPEIDDDITPVLKFQNKSKQSISIQNNYGELKHYLMQF